MKRKRQAQLGLNLQAHRLAFFIDDITNRVLNEKNIPISNSQYLVMKVIFILETPSQKDIANYLGISSPAVSRHLKILTGLEMVTVSGLESRSHKIELTKKGSKVFTKAMDILKDELEKEGFAPEKLGRRINRVLESGNNDKD